ncbi:MAG: hypothetical protein JW772_01475 [Candidatus Diapherotrites archaeon]|nr:hypothetical protein [Candidatus Diapherotrites archaeon]
MKTYPLISVLLLLSTFLLLGCPSTEETPAQIVDYAKKMPEAASILAEDPNAIFAADFLDASVMESKMSEFREKCPNSTLNIEPHWRVIIFSSPKRTTLLLSTPEKELVCKFTETTERDQCTINSNCDDKDDCTTDSCTGSPKKCVYTPITICADNDSCCPSNCNEQNDSDCIKNECEENTDCDDSDPSTEDACEGTPKKCVHTQITDCVDSDGFCPDNCSVVNDNDCETEDECSGPGDCDDKDPLTHNLCQGTPKKCVFELRTCAEAVGEKCASNEGCDGETVKTKDVSNCCLGKCKSLDECLSSSECNDQNPCTIDNCTGFPKKCSHTAITTCTDNDSCCPAACSYTSDSDCSIPTCSAISDELCPNACTMQTDIDCCIAGGWYCYLKQYEGGEYSCYYKYSKNPANKDQQCNPVVSQTSWSPTQAVLNPISINFTPFEPEPNELVTMEIVVYNEGVLALEGYLYRTVYISFANHNPNPDKSIPLPIPFGGHEFKTITYNETLRFPEEGTYSVEASIQNNADNLMSEPREKITYINVRTTPREPPCNVGTVCTDSTHYAYQNSDCSRTSPSECQYGCNTGPSGYGSCNTLP